MAIPESQLDTWSHQGSVQQSCDTYNKVRTALLDADSAYAGKDFEVFLQGSYGNDTNIYAESDVDVVIRLDSTFQSDTGQLSEAEKQAYQSYYSSASYSFAQFKLDVIAQLQRTFGSEAISVGSKAIKIKAAPNRRSADVVVCYEYRKFKSFSSQKTNDYVSGIIFPSGSGEIINYPKQHSSYLTKMHQETAGMLKPMVRILKNMRSRMVEKGMLRDGAAPSYYIEGMFYNVPTTEYDVTSFSNTFCNGVNWLLKTDKAKLVCANWQYYLLGSLNVQWNETDYNAFLSALCKLWNEG